MTVKIIRRCRKSTTKPQRAAICANDLAVRAAGAITAAEIRIALGRYCGSSGYLAALKEGDARVELDGEAAGRLTKARRRKPVITTHALPHRIGLADPKRTALARKAAAS